MVSFFCRQLATFLSNGGNINERNLIWRDFCRLRNPQRCNKTIKGPKAKVGPSKLLFLQPLIMRHDITLTLGRKILHFHLNRNSKDLWRFFLHWFFLFFLFRKLVKTHRKMSGRPIDRELWKRLYKSGHRCSSWPFLCIVWQKVSPPKDNFYCRIRVKYKAEIELLNR